MNRVVLTLVINFGVVCCAHANTILNGSFEATDFHIGYGCGNIADCYFGLSDPTHLFPLGPASFSPWVFTGGSGIALVGSAVGEPGSQDGDQYAFLQDTATISQAYSAPQGTPGILTFYLASRTNCCPSGEALTVTVGDRTLTLPDNSTLGSGWTMFTADFITSGAGSTTVTFSATGNGSILLDGVSASAVPEPASFFLVGLVILFPLFMAKRRIGERYTKSSQSAENKPDRLLAAAS